MEVPMLLLQYLTPVAIQNITSSYEMQTTIECRCPRNIPDSSPFEVWKQVWCFEIYSLWRGYSLQILATLAEDTKLTNLDDEMRKQ